MSGVPMNTSKLLCGMDENKQKEWRDVVQTSQRNPSFGISINESLANDVLYNQKRNNISSFPVQQICRISSDVQQKSHHRFCSATVKPDCQLVDKFKPNITCPFSADGKTNEECECIGIERNVTFMNTGDIVYCNCMHDSSKPKMNNTKACDGNYLFTKQCLLEKGNFSDGYTFRLNCDFTNCSSPWEIHFRNGTANESFYRPCTDASPIRTREFNRSSRMESMQMLSQMDKSSATYKTLTVTDPSKKHLSTHTEHYTNHARASLAPNLLPEALKQTDTSSIVSGITLAFLICTALGLTVFFVKTQKGKEARKRLSKRLTRKK